MSAWLDPAFTVRFSLSASHLANRSFLHTIQNSYVFLKGWEPTALPSLPFPPPSSPATSFEG